MGHRSSPVFTVKGVREAVGKCGVQPEIHDKGYDDGKFLLLKTKDLAEAWKMWDCLVNDGFNLGTFSGPIEDSGIQN